MQEQIDRFNSLPSNEELKKLISQGDGENRPRPVSDMWQTMQIKNKVDGHEEGIKRVNHFFYIDSFTVCDLILSFTFHVHIKILLPLLQRRLYFQSSVGLFVGL